MSIELEEEPFITTAEAAKLLGVSKDTIEGWRYGRSRSDHGPPCYRFAHNVVRYKASEVLAWAKQHRFENGVKVAPPTAGQQPRPWEQPR